MTKKEYKLQLAILLDEKRNASLLLKELKSEPDKTMAFKAVRIFRNRICKEIRELKYSQTT